MNKMTKELDHHVELLLCHKCIFIVVEVKPFCVVSSFPAKSHAAEKESLRCNT